MQPLKYLSKWLFDLSEPSKGLFISHDLRCLFPDLSDGAFYTLLSRAVSSGLLLRVCKKIYLFKKGWVNDGLMLFHVVALLRSNQLNYMSLETALSDYGVISQIPMNWISIMSSGRSNIIDCNEFGSIEFIHTTQIAINLKDSLIYDHRIGLWRASPQLAFRDMKRTNRSMDLIDKERLNELI